MDARVNLSPRVRGTREPVNESGPRAGNRGGGPFRGSSGYETPSRRTPAGNLRQRCYHAIRTAAPFFKAEGSIAKPSALGGPRGSQGLSLRVRGSLSEMGYLVVWLMVAGIPTLEVLGHGRLRSLGSPS